MKQSIILNSRQKELLRTFINEKKPISYKYLSDYFKLSVRTIQREIKSLTPILKDYHIKITRNLGSGLELQGTKENIEKLYAQVEQAHIMTNYSPEERQEGIAYDLLLSNEPIKQGYFSTRFGVSTTTISYDLDKVSAWLKEDGVTVERSPGIGIYIDSTEQQRRTLLSRLLHKDITFEDWLELFHEPVAEETLYGKLGSIIRNRLLKFVQTDKIIDVDSVLNEVLEEQSDFVLTDRNYVNLMIHIMLAMERIQSGKVIEYTNLSHWEPFDLDTLSTAKKIVERLEQVSSLTFPEIEIKYISLHLAGAKVSRKKEAENDNDQEFLWIELTQSFIRSIEHYLDHSFEGDQLLFEGLVSHFAPVFNRLKYGLQIHNPMLERIKKNYPDVFIACQQACTILTDKTGYPIPEDEIGYLAMHIGASLLRVENDETEQYKAVVICASGLGTSIYLATKIQSEISNVEVEAVISATELNNWLQDGHDVDIVISTVNLPVSEDRNIVVVSPFLKKEDLEKIKNTLASTVHTAIRNIPENHRSKKRSEDDSSPLFSLAAYGEGVVQILRYFHLYENVTLETNIITSLLEIMKNVPVISDHNMLIDDLKKREQLGGFVLSELAMLHTKSKGVTSPIVSVFRSTSPIPWYGDDGKKQSIKVIILLVVPIDAPAEHMEIISEIPAAFIEETFFEGIITGEEHEVKDLLKGLLSKHFEQRITS